jgi:type II secretory pathway pseudopilin PulG
MILRLATINEKGRTAGFTLAEVLVSLFAFGLVTSGLIYGYVQINRMAEWSSMSLAAQSYASQGLEQAKSAQWNYVGDANFGPGTGDELGYPVAVGYISYFTTNTMDIPTTGAPINVTNFITITNVFPNNNPPLRQIRSDCVWTFPLNGKLCTNTAITLRAPDQ